MTNLLTSTEAARLLGTDRTTTSKAAAGGKVEGVYRDPRPGTINPPWVATESAWREWYVNRRPSGRPTREERIRMLRDKIGKPWDEVAQAVDWLDHYPVVDEFGIIHDVVNADEDSNRLREERGIEFDEAAECYRIDLNRAR